MKGLVMACRVPMTLAPLTATMVLVVGEPFDWRGGSEEQFRSRADVVVVDVSVLSGTQPVEGLEARDFLLTDNGVPQRVERAAIDSAPLELTVLVDSTLGMREEIDRLKASVHRVHALLASDDRMTVHTFSWMLREVADVRRASGAWMDGLDLAPHGVMSPRDALAMLLIRGASAERRHLVALFTYGKGYPIALEPGRLSDIASRFDGVVHVVLFGGDADEELRAVADVTGGQLHRGSPSRVAQAFEGIFDTFRSSYVLQYQPQGVAREGWHAIDVKVTIPGANRLAVRARKGYWWN